DPYGIVHMYYTVHATPPWDHVSPANTLWLNPAIPQPRQSPARARELLAASGFGWASDGTLIDRSGKTVEFSIVTNAGNAERVQMTTIIQDDLRRLGMRVHAVTLEFRTLLDRVMKTHEYEAAVMGLGGLDV